MTIKPDPGIYAVVFHSDSSSDLQVGRWGYLSIKPGYYIYIGSAFGSGGVRARVSRHLREHKTKRWHIDYLRELVIPVCVWCSYVPFNLEHKWAQSVVEIPGIFRVKGFGCSDCKCYTHLFFMTSQPEFARFSEAVGGGITEVWPYQTAALELTVSTVIKEGVM